MDGVPLSKMIHLRMPNQKITLSQVAVGYSSPSGSIESDRLDPFSVASFFR